MSTNFISYALYVRVTEENDEAIEEQLNQLIKEVISDSEAFDLGMHVYVDNGYTGYDATRPAYSQMKKDIKMLGLTDIYVTNMNRLTRDTEELDAWLELEEEGLYITETN